MFLRKPGHFAITLILALTIAPAGKTDEVSDARKAIQAAYDKEASALTHRDYKGMYAAHSPDFVDVSSFEGNTRKFKRDLAGQSEAVRFQRFQSISRKISIQQFQWKGGVAIVDCTVHDSIVMTDPQAPKTGVPFVDEDVSRDTWTKGDQGWRLTSTEILEGPLLPASRQHSRFYTLLSSFSQEPKAIQNGQKVIQMLTQKEKASDVQALQSWVGKPVAFLCGLGSKGFGVYSSPDSPPIKLEFNFVRPLGTQPIVLEVCVLGTIKSIDARTKTIVIEVSPENWSVRRTG